MEPATAQRLACDATLLGAVTNSAGEVLHLGRTRRLVSRAQRRALAIRDRICRYHGCAQTRHLDAHHVIPWAHKLAAPKRLASSPGSGSPHPGRHLGHELIAAGLPILAGVSDGDQLEQAVRVCFERGRASLQGYDPSS